MSVEAEGFWHLCCIQFCGLQPASVMNVILRCYIEKDGLVLLGGSVVFVGGEILLAGLDLFLLRMLLHMGNKALGGPFNLLRVKLIGRAWLLHHKLRWCALLLLALDLSERLGFRHFLRVMGQYNALLAGVLSTGSRWMCGRKLYGSR